LCSMHRRSPSVILFPYTTLFRSPEELAIKDNPANPGSHAMILEWRDSEDDNTGYKDVYLRIKIFTEEGKKYGDIEIPYLKDFHSDRKSTRLNSSHRTISYAVFCL